MTFTETPIPGAFLVESPAKADERGSFARTYCRKAFAERGLSAEIAQCSVSQNRRRGTLRGLHLQASPHEEAKLVSCLRGSLYDVILDLRPGSATFGKWHAVELDERRALSLYIPKGLAHGFQTLEDQTTVHYQISEFFHPESAGGVRWNDPAFAVRWPIEDPILSEADRCRPDFAAKRP